MLTKEAKLSTLARLASKWRLNKVRKGGLGFGNLQHLLRNSPTLGYLDTLRNARKSTRLLAGATAANLKKYPDGIPILGEGTAINWDTVEHIITNGGTRPLSGSTFKLDDWNPLVEAARKYALGDRLKVAAYNTLSDFFNPASLRYLYHRAPEDVAKRLSSSFNRFDVLNSSVINLRNINAGIRGILESLRSTKLK